MVNCIEKTLKKAAITWKNVEPNLICPIINHLLEVNNGNIKDLNTWDKEIKEQGYIR